MVCPRSSSGSGSSAAAVTFGFSPDEIEEPVIEDKIKARRKRGWGLKIIRGLMDEVEIRSGSEGTTVVMSKLRGTA